MEKQEKRFVGRKIQAASCRKRFSPSLSLTDVDRKDGSSSSASSASRGTAAEVSSSHLTVLRGAPPPKSPNREDNLPPVRESERGCKYCWCRSCHRHDAYSLSASRSRSSTFKMQQFRRFNGRFSIFACNLQQELESRPGDKERWLPR